MTLWFYSPFVCIISICVSWKTGTKLVAVARTKLMTYWRPIINQRFCSRNIQIANNFPMILRNFSNPSGKSRRLNVNTSVYYPEIERKKKFYSKYKPSGKKTLSREIRAVLRKINFNPFVKMRSTIKWNEDSEILRWGSDKATIKGPRQCCVVFIHVIPINIFV